MSTRLSGRPMLYTSYGSEMALLNTPTKRVAVLVLLAVGLALPWLPQSLMPDERLLLLSRCCVAAIGAIGLGIVTGYAGQVSLGHAFFLAVGAYTAAAISGTPSGRVTIGFEIPEVLVWLPAAGLVAALAGALVAPLATRLRGLYLAIVTLGLVFIGEYVFNEWEALTGGNGIGRPGPTLSVLGNNLGTTDAYMSADQKRFLFVFGLLVVFGVAARGLVRSRVGRAFTAIRDRDIAAGVIGVNLARYKTVAFAVSSFYAGCAGALLYSLLGFIDPTSFNLELSVVYVAMVFVGGAGTISGAIMGAFFFTLLPSLTRLLLPASLLSSSETASLNIFQLQAVLYGALIIVFLIFEPRGLFGIWLRIRNYWKAWPFSY
jgi:branched-chain amino acid transport system permease protein